MAEESFVSFPLRDLGNLNCWIATILSSLKSLCETGMIWDYKIGDRLYRNVELVFYFNFVKCDTAEADNLCGRYGTRGRGVQNVCRYCDCPTDQLDRVVLPPTVKPRFALFLDVVFLWMLSWMYVHTHIVLPCIRICTRTYVFTHHGSSSEF